jgi:hypothetical protein
VGWRKSQVGDEITMAIRWAMLRGSVGRLESFIISTISIKFYLYVGWICVVQVNLSVRFAWPSRIVETVDGNGRILWIESPALSQSYFSGTCTSCNTRRSLRSLSEWFERMKYIHTSYHYTLGWSQVYWRFIKDLSQIFNIYSINHVPYCDSVKGIVWVQHWNSSFSSFIVIVLDVAACPFYRRSYKELDQAFETTITFSGGSSWWGDWCRCIDQSVVIIDNTLIWYLRIFPERAGLHD